MKEMVSRLLLVGCLLGGIGFMHSCSLGYYGHTISSHLSLMSDGKAIVEVVEDPALDPTLRNQLLTALEIRRFASDELHLPDNQSYTRYVGLDREYVSWVVTASPEFSLQKRRWCFPVAGCVTYRGYYDQDRAHRFAEQLIDQGYDVNVSGVSAYSTLGWFSDPVFSPMLRGSEARLAEVIFHELAHQQLYVRGDPAFNEAYASFVGEKGAEMWLRTHRNEQQLNHWLGTLDRRAGFDALLTQTRRELRELYNSDLSEPDKRDQKKATFDRLRARYDALAEMRPDYRAYASWFDRPLNNAHVGHNATYRRWVPAFQVLFEQQNEDFKRFHEEAARLARLSREEREFALNNLASQAESTGHAQSVVKAVIEELSG